MGRKNPDGLYSPTNLPLTVERDYQTKIRKIVTRVKDIIDKNVIVALPTIMNSVEALRPKSDSERLDETISEQVNSLFKSTRIQIGEQITDFEISQMVQGTASEINGWNKFQTARVFKQALGIDIFSSEPYLQEELTIFTINNVNLITNVNQSFVDQAESTVFEGMRRGLRHEEISKQIVGFGKDELGKVSRFRTAKNRANLIGRDQTNKLNGNLTRLRQTNVGVKKYFWRTVGDTRVRERHKHWDGDVVLWSKGKDGGIHPGDEIQCRCYPEPDFSDLLN